MAWVRALALSLARDANVADDVAQEAYLLALERPPRKASRLGPWMARVTRTLARQEARGSRSRREREQIAAQRTDDGESVEPFEVLERGHRQRSVVDAVLSLPEPYASTVLYHYLDGLSAAEVAQRMDCEPATVRKRLERARSMLRERLDREFGCETESWALGLVLPLADLRAPTAATGAASAGTKALVAGGLMGSKTIGLLGLVLAGGLLVLTRGYFADAEPEGEELPAVVQETAVLEPEIPEVPRFSETVPASARINLPVIVGADAAATVPRDVSPEDGALLLVRGIGPDGTPVTTGRVDCFWGPEDRLGTSSKQQHVGSPISSEVTRIELPGDARSVRISVSNASFEPSPGAGIRNLRGSQGELQGVVVHEVDVPLDVPAPGPFVYGDIYLDGQRGCPPGLRVFLNGRGQAWINTVTSRYRFGPLMANSGSLMVVSDFCLPTSCELDEEGSEDQRIDLKLESGRELLVFAVDARTGAPAVGRRVSIQVSNPVKRTLFQVTSSSHRQSARVDAAGYCRFQGIPIKGQVSISQRLDDGVGHRVLETVRLESDMPRVVECEVRLEPTAAVKTRVFGTLPVGAHTGAQGQRTIKFKSWSGGGTSTASVDAEGNWSAELDSHQMWSVQAELDGQPRSKDKLIELKGEAELGPVQLGWQGGLPLTLQFVDVPATGRIVIEYTEDEGGWSEVYRIEAHGEDLEQELLLYGPVTVEISLTPVGGSSKFGLRQRIEVDPRSERVRLIDLGGSRGRDLTILINGERPPGDSHLILMLPGSPGSAPARVLFPLNEGQANEPQVIDGGRWLYFLRHEKYPGFVIGWLDVSEESTGRLSIDWQGALRPTAELGSGLELQGLGGHDLQEWLPGFKLPPWSPEQLAEEALWLPTNLTYEVIE